MLRRWLPGDGEWYVGQLGDPEIRRFTLEDVSTTAKQFRSALARLEHEVDRVGFAVVDPATGQLAGNLAASRHDDVAEVSYWIAAASRGRGLAHDAVTELCVWIVEHWPDVESVTLWVHADNLASQRVALKAGFVRQPELDELKLVRGDHWPVRWYTRALGKGGNRPIVA